MNIFSNLLGSVVTSSPLLFRQVVFPLTDLPATIGMPTKLGFVPRSSSLQILSWGYEVKFPPFQQLFPRSRRILYCLVLALYKCHRLLRIVIIGGFLGVTFIVAVVCGYRTMQHADINIACEAHGVFHDALVFVYV